MPCQPSNDASESTTSSTGVSPPPSSPVKRPAISPLSKVDSASPAVQAIALYDFEGDASLGDLVFRAGETIVEVHSVSEEWMSGRIGDRMGNFPMAFVRIL